MHFNASSLIKFIQGITQNDIRMFDKYGLFIVLGKIQYYEDLCVFEYANNYDTFQQSIDA